MAVLVMVYGHSGSGKSASLRNFDPEQGGGYQRAWQAAAVPQQHENLYHK